MTSNSRRSFIKKTATASAVVSFGGILPAFSAKSYGRNSNFLLSVGLLLNHKWMFFTLGLVFIGSGPVLWLRRRWLGQVGPLDLPADAPTEGADG